MIVEIIKLLHTNKFIGAGKYTEIAKGQNEIGFIIRKIKRKYGHRKNY